MDYKGLRWFKCDFHLHTMSSLCYKEREKDTIDNWVDEVRNKELQCIAITDHNDYRGIADIKKKAQEAGIVVFPGVELSCDSVKVHMLIIFDTTETEGRIQELLNQVGIFSESLGKSEVTCQGDIFRVCEKAHNMGALVIAAHIDEFNGLCEISYDNLCKVLNREYIDAVQIVNEDIWATYKENIKWKEMCENLTAKYGKEISEERAKRWNLAYNLALKSELPILTFSDNPHSECESNHGLWGIGRSYTWIKMDSTPDLESVRQAFLSFDMRIKRCSECSVQPEVSPEMWIRGIKITNTTLNETNDITVDFNPQLNTIIGGRGSGKSSIIRLIAGGMESFEADGLDDIRDEQGSFYQENKKDKSGVFKGVFKIDSCLCIFFERAGDSYRMDIKNIKKMLSQERYLYKLVNGEWIEVEDKNYLDFFKAQVYTQKQIYEIAKDSNSILNIIDEDISELNQMVSERDIAFDSVIANALEVNNIRKTILEEGMIRSELKDIEDQISKFEKSGISDALKEKQKIEMQRKIVEDYMAKRKSWIERINAVTEEIIGEKNENFEIDDNEILLMIQKNDKLFLEKIESVANITKSMELLMEEFSKNIDKSEWNVNGDKVEENYLGIINKLQEQGVNLDRLGDLLEKKKNKMIDIDKINEEKKRLVAAEGRQEKLYLEYENVVKRISEKRIEFIRSVIGKDANVKFEIQKGRNRTSFVQMMRNVLGKENVTINENIEKMADLFFEKNGMIEFRKKVQEIREEVDTKSYHARMRNAIIELQPESYARMVSFIPEDDLRVSYRPENSKKYIPLSNASAGQKTTAILTFLLAYGDMPLLLDQPEDDLDNKLVYDLIVARLKEAKTKRQIIVVTHNANIPVNADAEYIVSMDSESEQVNIKFDGTMDDKDIRKEICDVMEGTQFAFEMRAKKYHFRIVE